VEQTRGENSGWVAFWERSVSNVEEIVLVSASIAKEEDFPK
jgi:hypothetical protein